MKRGDVVVVSAPGDYGKPRPAVIVQTDALDESHASVIVCLISSRLVGAPLLRLDVVPSASNGLRRASQVMVDKIVTLRRDRIAQRIGALDKEALGKLNRMLALVLGLGDS